MNNCDDYKRRGIALRVTPTATRASVMMCGAGVQELALNQASMEPHEKNRLYQEGLEAFNSGQFFEAHELWEDVWRDTQGPDRRFLQGLIQIAAAFHHASRANLVGAQKLLQAGVLKLEEVPEVHCGLEIGQLRGAVRAWLAATASRTVEDAQSARPPKIACEAGARAAVWHPRES